MQIILTQQERDLTEFLSRLLNTSCPIQLSHTVLAFPDPLKIKLFELVSLTLNIDIALVNQLFKRLVFKSVQTLRLQCQNLNSLSFKVDQTLQGTKVQDTNECEHVQTTDCKNTRCYNLSKNAPRTQSKEQIEFQNRFSSSLQTVLKLKEVNNKILSEKAVCYLQNNNSIQFYLVKKFHSRCYKYSKSRL
ncbi:Hypothetical_protein [Hexamita inflata]|uniref:Hypothetical_protein n=1 Tax=Hexamita inflata TaxID=28002 RepID=A0AA86RMB5_9EUKA|nr:Hypothetical protein HINF_LOCUS62122 [Hexamita inflata]